jgi:hypothetical protein
MLLHHFWEHELLYLFVFQQPSQRTFTPWHLFFCNPSSIASLAPPPVAEDVVAAVAAAVIEVAANTVRK